MVEKLKVWFDHRNHAGIRSRNLSSDKRLEGSAAIEPLERRECAALVRETAVPA